VIVDQFSQGIGGLVAGIAVFVAVASLLFSVLIIVIVANRAEPDPRGLRPMSVYLFGMSFVTLQFTFAGSVLIVTALCSLIAPHDVPMTNTVAREIVIGVLLLVLAGGTWAIHVLRGVETGKGDGPSGPNRRVMQSYGAVVGFVYFLQALFALGFGVYLVIALIAPGVFGSIDSSRSGTLAALLELVYVIVASGAVVLWHANLGPSVLGRTAPADTRTVTLS
jgi:hypothetical protein